jgi:beta-mannosidase
MNRVLLDGGWEVTSQGPSGDVDAREFWYRRRMPRPAGGRAHLVFDGLATLAEVFLDGQSILRSENMFLRHRVDVTAQLREGSELTIRIGSLTAKLKETRPRPRWKTRLVRDQGLRFIRTTLMGRMPGWCPETPPVGPWRPVWLETGEGTWVEDRQLVAHGDGRVKARIGFGGDVPRQAALRVGETETALDSGGAGELKLPEVARWWPHTHGPQPLYPVSLLADGERFELGSIGFRSIELEDPDAFALLVNGVRIFARGACWTPGPSATLSALREAGMNMVRLSGCFGYETDAFHALCDQLGILVWQDFAFSSLDYPRDEPFLSSAREEARQLLNRLAVSPSLAVLCGNNEVAQQAAMLGLRDEPHPLFEAELPALCRSRRPDVPYWPSSPGGGALPFQPDAGDCHYYGVGAFRRPPEDARRSGVRFASECLAFAQPPSAWSPVRERTVPRDAGADWDFADVLAHYAGDRSEVASRATAGDLMAATFAEWRRTGSRCSGGLVWYARDLEPGAGLGVLDAQGLPKSSWFALRRVLAPVALLAIDEGLGGIHLHAINDGAAPLDAVLRWTAWRGGDVRVFDGEKAISIPARGAVATTVEALAGHFCDSAWAYRFGPAPYQMGRAELLQGSAVLAETFVFLEELPRVELSARVRPFGENRWELTVAATGCARGVWIDTPGFMPSDDHFHLAPGMSRRIVLTGLAAGTLSGSVQALNAGRVAVEGG